MLSVNIFKTKNSLRKYILEIIYNGNSILRKTTVVIVDMIIILLNSAS